MRDTEAAAVADAVPVGEASPVAEAVCVADDLPVDADGAVTCGDVFTELLARGVDEEVGVLGCDVGMDGELEPGPLGVQAVTATATSSAPANVVRRSFMKPSLAARADNRRP